MSNPVETVLNQVWTNSFQSGPYNILQALAHTDNSALSDASYSSGDIDICSHPWSRGSGPSPDGDGHVRAQNMRVSGLANASNGGAPTYSDSDKHVSFPLKLNQFVINGRYTIEQSCCNSWVFTCVGHSTAEDHNDFKLTVTDSTAHILCAITPPPTALLVQGVNLALGHTSLSVPSGLPDWLDWLSKLFSNRNGILGSIERSARVLLGSPPLLKQMQDSMNALLKPPKAVAAVTPARLAALLSGHGLPPGAYPAGPLLVSKDSAGGYVFEQQYEARPPASSTAPWRRFDTQVVVSGGDDGGAYQLSIQDAAPAAPSL
jgi:hypothetical protein